MEEVESEKTFGEYLAVLRRHKIQILAVTAVLAAIAGAVTVGLPPSTVPQPSWCRSRDTSRSGALYYHEFRRRASRLSANR
jgi:hypothetical protein